MPKQTTSTHLTRNVGENVQVKPSMSVAKKWWNRTGKIVGVHLTSGCYTVEIGDSQLVFKEDELEDAKPTNPKHGLGPWLHDQDCVRCLPDDGDGGTFICQMDSSRSPEETRANQDLICDAPELIAALSNLVQVLDSHVSKIDLSIAEDRMLHSALYLLETHNWHAAYRELQFKVATKEVEEQNG
jgi:hypothetical protein